MEVKILSQELMNTLATYGPIVFLGIIFYFMLYRPQKKEQKRRDTLLSGLKKGDRIVTIGGLYGTIVGFSDKTVSLKIADKVEITVLRTAVSGYQNDNK
jgi:preprotein translocase subunit YajC